MADDSRLCRDPVGFLRLANPPSVDELRDFYSKKYFQTEQGNYQKSYTADELKYINLKIEQKAYRINELREGVSGRLLDVGCGEGFVLSWFGAKGWSVEGIDYSTAGIEANNPEFAEKLDAGDLFDLLDQRIKNREMYDVVWLDNVLEHVLDPMRLLESIKSIVMLGGVVVVTVPNDSSAYQEMLLERGHITKRFWIAIPDHISYFNYSTLVRAVKVAGWNCCDVLADFPIDLFLLHPASNYVLDRTKGKEAHKARLELEILLANQPIEYVNAYYASMARVGLGRQLTVFLQKKTAT